MSLRLHRNMGTLLQSTVLTTVFTPTVYIISKEPHSYNNSIRQIMILVLQNGRERKKKAKFMHYLLSSYLLRKERYPVGSFSLMETKLARVSWYREQVVDKGKQEARPLV